MGEVPAKVHYHVKKLESAGILKLQHTKEINGIVAKFYQPTVDHSKSKIMKLVILRSIIK